MIRKGRILKVKLGYNPNSSSIGTDIVMFFVSFTAIGLIFNSLSVFIKRQFKNKDSEEENEDKS